jgi:predicted ATPase
MPSSIPLPAIGRERELATLRAALDQALSHQAQVTLLTGEAGIGKTWLARTFESVLRECGVPRRGLTRS